MTKHRSLTDLMQAGITIPAISYGRVSSEKQLSGEGLKRRRTGTLEWIAKHPEYRIRLDAEKEDEARSAWKGTHVADHGALGKILEMVETEELRPPLMLIVEALDRLSRQNPWQANAQLSGLVAKGIFVATTRDDRIYSMESGIGDMILSIVAMSTAHEESESKSVRVHATKIARVEEAKVTKQVLHQNCPGWLTVDDAVSTTNRTTRRYARIERHCKTVQTIYEMGLHHGAEYICAWLMQNDVENFGKSGRWNAHYVKCIVRSRAPIGHLQAKSGLIEDIFPKVISEDLWLRAQAAADARVGQGGIKTGAYVNIFAGLCRCSECEGMMRINTNLKSGYRYYECKNHSAMKNCGNTARYRVDILESAVLSDLGWLSAAPAPVAVPDDIDGIRDEVLKLKARETRLASRLKELDDDDLFDVVLGQLRDLRGEINTLNTRLVAAAKASVVAVPPTIGDLTDRPALASAMRSRLRGVFFGADHEVMVVSSGGALLMVAAKHNGPAPRLMVSDAAAKQMAMIADGKVTIADAIAGLPKMDRQTHIDLARHIVRTRAR